MSAYRGIIGVTILALTCLAGGCGGGGGGGGTATATRSLAVADQTASPGSSITVPVTISNAAGIAGIDITLTYNPSLLTATDAATTSLTGDFALQRNITAGQIRIAMANATGIASGSGALVNISCTVSSGAAKGQSCSLHVASMSLYDQMAQAITCSAKDGTFTVQ